MVNLVPYSEEDFLLLEQCNSPQMTAHLGGSETAEKLLRRHQRYAKELTVGQMFKIEFGDTAAPAGLIGFWEHDWRGELVWETGWSVLPAFQGRGIAGSALDALLLQVRQDQKHQFIHAFPSLENLASNAVCRRRGFTLLEECDFEYPPGHTMRCNDWALDLLRTSQTSS